MKDTKFYPLLLLSIVFLIISFVMLCILGYNVYTQTAQRKQTVSIKASVPGKIAAPVLNKTRDSLQLMYAATVSDFKPDARIDSAFTTADTMQGSLLDNKLTDFYKLRNEISTLLKDNSSVADLELARFKIKELQIKLDQLKNRNIDIENENRRLHALLEQFSKTNNSTVLADTRPTEAVAVKTVVENSSSAVFSASELRLAAASESDTEVSNADEAEKFVGSFVVRNSLNQGTGEVMLVLIQPDGKILRNAWESGSFEADGGKKIYSRKIRFDYNKGEAHRLNFTVPLDSCQKGTYTLQLYSRGKVIGRVVKVVS
ncbi:MAG: hypothetical protein IPP72_06430 [Chitinophagaceae bacterium]|nr:hypothetical protein [Chitinophagaceae bacterium]